MLITWLYRLLEDREERVRREREGQHPVAALTLRAQCPAWVDWRLWLVSADLLPQETPCIPRLARWAHVRVAPFR